MSPRDDPGEQLLDLLVYAPLGLLLEVRDLVPKLADKGRQRMGPQMKVARFVGQFAVRRGQTKVEEVFTRLREQPRRPDSSPPGGATSTDGPTNGSQPAASRPAATRPAASRPTATRPPTTRPAAGRPAPATAAAAGPEPAAATLSIPGYDTLSASQVVPRLEGLSPQELEAVRAYESTSRRRKTILTRIDQLLGGH